MKILDEQNGYIRNDGTVGTITTDAAINNIRIRKLTPRECWRLMDFTDEQFDRAKYTIKHFWLEGDEEICNASSLIATEKQRHTNTDTYALCTINDSQDTEILKTIIKSGTKNTKDESTVNVNIVIERLEKAELLDSVTNTTKCFTFTGMQCTLMGENDQHQVTGIIVSVKGRKANTEKCMKITTVSGLPLTKWYIILTLLKPIIESSIFTSLTVRATIQGVTKIIKDKNGNILMRLSNLKMEHISERMSDSRLYMQAGNSIVVKCLELIFRQMM